MIGYDHALALQAALLMDDEPRIRKLAGTLVRAVYSKNGPEPWVVAEGAVMHEKEDVWYRLGMGANTIHVAETLKVIRLMVGVDDLTAGRLKFLPRLPSGWSGCSVSKMPFAGSRPGMRVGYDLERTARGIAFAYEAPGCGCVDVRLGPLARPPRRVRLDGALVSLAETVRLRRGGYWCWLRGLQNERASIRVEAEG